MTIRACLFDAYGTLFDVHSAIGQYHNQLGANADAISALWRTKQLEYTWLHSLMGQYADFWHITTDALRYAFEAYRVNNPPLFDSLLQAYLTLTAYPDVKKSLETLKMRDVGRYILSNGTPAMLQAAVNHAEIEDFIEERISVDRLQIYKPAPQVYRLGMERVGIEEPNEILFVSANGWDIAGAGAFGFQTAWINRAGMPIEQLPTKPTYVMTGVRDIAALLEL
jgi:2-haloacid dehalogenase